MDKSEVLARCEAAIRAGNDVAEAAMALRDALEDRRFNSNWQFWSACNLTSQMEHVMACAEPLLPCCGEFVVHTKPESTAAILQPLTRWTDVRFPHINLIGGIYARTFWETRLFEDVEAWRALARVADKVRWDTGNNAKCLVDFEKVPPIEAFNKGNYEMDFSALRRAIDESGILDCGVDFIFYGCEIQPNILLESAQLTFLLAEKFPTARVMESNIGRLDWVTDSARAKCAKGMLDVWGDRLYRRVLAVHPDDGDHVHYPPEQVPAAMTADGSKRSLWITGNWENRPETARLLASAFAAQRARGA